MSALTKKVTQWSIISPLSGFEVMLSPKKCSVNHFPLNKLPKCFLIVSAVITGGVNAKSKKWNKQNNHNPTTTKKQTKKKQWERTKFEQAKVDLRMEHKLKWIPLVLMECDKGVNNSQWHFGFDLSDTPEMKEACLNQFSSPADWNAKSKKTHPEVLWYCHYMYRKKGAK